MKAIASFWQIYQLIRLIKLSQCGRSPWKSFRVITLPENQRQWRGRGWQYYSPTTFFAWINNSPMARPFYLDANPTWKDLTFSLVRALESCFILTTVYNLWLSGEKDGCSQWKTLGKSNKGNAHWNAHWSELRRFLPHNVTRKSEGLVGDPTPSRKRRTSTRLEVGVLAYP